MDLIKRKSVTICRLFEHNLLVFTVSMNVWMTAKTKTPSSASAPFTWPWLSFYLLWLTTSFCQHLSNPDQKFNQKSSKFWVKFSILSRPSPPDMSYSLVLIWSSASCAMDELYCQHTKILNCWRLLPRNVLLVCWSMWEAFTLLKEWRKEIFKIHWRLSSPSSTRSMLFSRIV